MALRCSRPTSEAPDVLNCLPPICGAAPRRQIPSEIAPPRPPVKYAPAQARFFVDADALQADPPDVVDGPRRHADVLLRPRPGPEAPARAASQDRLLPRDCQD